MELPSFCIDRSAQRRRFVSLFSSPVLEATYHYAAEAGARSATTRRDLLFLVSSKRAFERWRSESSISRSAHHAEAERSRLFGGRGAVTSQASRTLSETFAPFLDHPGSRPGDRESALPLRLRVR